jgi:hypothetical protein
MIYFCTNFKQASSKEKGKIEAEIEQQPELHYTLDQLKGDVVMVS